MLLVSEGTALVVRHPFLPLLCCWGGGGVNLYFNLLVSNHELALSASLSLFLFQMCNIVGYFRGRVPNFNQSDARKQCFLAADWLKFETFPE